MGQKLLSKLEQGETIFGTCITAAGVQWAKAIESSGLDFVFIDTEHIPLGISAVAQMCQVYSSRNISPVVRIPSANAASASMMLDLGAEGVVAPYIENISQVKELVGAVKYRPLKGQRLVKVLEDPAIMEPELRTYLENYNRGKMCILNIESLPAAEHLEGLISVPGVDAVFIGPHDLSVNLGLPEKYDHPEFEKIIRHIIHTCRSRKIAVGIHFSETPDRQLRWMAEGTNIVIHGSDFALFYQKIKQDLKQLKSVKGTSPITISDDLIV